MNPRSQKLSAQYRTEITVIKREQILNEIFYTLIFMNE